MGQPIATQGCYHVCPASDGPKPHVGGPVLQGSPTVYAGGKPVCRQNDPLQCQSSAFDTVIKGSTTVFANGLPIARMNDQTAHGGMIQEGNPLIAVG